MGTTEPSPLVIEEDPFPNIFEKFDKLEQQELVIHQMTNWTTLLSQECKFTTDPIHGIVESKIDSLSGSECFLLVPVDNNSSEPYDIRDFHTILKDLTCGIFAFNQPPDITLEPNHNLTSSCALPPAYLDTLTGRILVEFDHWIKSLWHGVGIDRDSRMRLMDKWRDLEFDASPSNISLLVATAGDGIVDLAKDPSYAEFYSQIPVELPYDDEMTQDRELFETWMERNSLSLRLVLMPGDFIHRENVLLCENIDHFVDTIIRAMDDEISVGDYLKLFARLNYQRNIVNNCMAKKLPWSRTFALLKLISVLTVFVQTARNQKSKIPSMSNLFCQLQGDMTKTEHELPPVVIPPSCTARTFANFNKASTGICTNLHGGIGFLMDTGVVNNSEEITDEFIEEVIQEGRRVTEQYCSDTRPTQQKYFVPTIKFKGKSYNILHIRLDDYVPPPNTKPNWLAHILEETTKRMKESKRLIVADVVIHDTFKHVFGYAKAIKCKNSEVGFSSSVQRGLLAIFYTLLKRVNTARLSAQNERGYALLHMSAIFNRVNMAAILISLGMDFNSKRGAYVSANGPTALHIAARAGSLEVVSCLSSLGGAEYANLITSTDQFGWTPIHIAAYFDHVPMMVMMLRRLYAADKDVLSKEAKLDTSDDIKHTPLMLTATSGALSTMQMLIEMGAPCDQVDKKNNGIVELAVLHFHTHILQWLIGKKMPNLNVFEHLARMLEVEEAQKKDPAAINRAAAAARCIDIITAKNNSFWRLLLSSGAVRGLVTWLVLPPDLVQATKTRRNTRKGSHRSESQATTEESPEERNDTETPGTENSGTRSGAASSRLSIRREQALIAKLQVAMKNLISASISALCNIGAEPEIRTELARLGAGQKLSEMLIIPDANIQARAATVLGDICCDPEQQCRLADVAFRNIVPLLEESSEDVLVAAVNALRFLVTGNSINQSRIASYSVDAVQAIVDFLSVAESNALRGAASACVAALAAGHSENQSLLLELNAAPSLVALLKVRNVSVAVRAAAAVAALAADNPKCQQKLFELDAAKPLVRVLKMVFVPLGTTSDDEAEPADKFKLDAKRTQEISAWSLEVKEQTMTALWALAGHTVAQRRRVAELISLQTLVELLITESDPLRRHSAFAIAAFCRVDRQRQIEVFQCNAVQPILRLIRAHHKVSEDTLVLLVEALGGLCYLPAFTANEETQKLLFQEGALKDLLRLLISTLPPANSQLVRVTILKTLALLTLSNAELRNILFTSLGFRLEPLLSMVSNVAEDSIIRLGACEALATFALHNSPLQLKISEFGGLRYEVFAPFLNAAGWNERCQAAFQIVLLSRIVSDSDQVALTAAGVLVLVQALAIRGDCNLLSTVCNLIGTLCHGRSGVADAFVSAQVLQPLIYHLMNEENENVVHLQDGTNIPTMDQQVYAQMGVEVGDENAKSGGEIKSSSLIEEVQQSAAIALSFFTRNRTARRLLLSECRKNAVIYNKLHCLATTAGFTFDNEFENEYSAIAVHQLHMKRSGTSLSKLSSSRLSTASDRSPPMRPKTASSGPKPSILSATPSELRSSLSSANRRSKKPGNVTIVGTTD